MIFLESHILSVYYFCLLFSHVHLLSACSIKQEKMTVLKIQDIITKSNSKFYQHYKLIIKLIWKNKCLWCLRNFWKRKIMREKFVLPDSNVF
jgi:hypothetical protein